MLCCFAAGWPPNCSCPCLPTCNTQFKPKLQHTIQTKWSSSLQLQSSGASRRISKHPPAQRGHGRRLRHLCLCLLLYPAATVTCTCSLHTVYLAVGCPCCSCDNVSAAAAAVAWGCVCAVWCSDQGGQLPREVHSSAQGASQRRHQQQVQPQGAECSSRIATSLICAEGCVVELHSSPCSCALAALKPAARTQTEMLGVVVCLCCTGHHSPQGRACGCGYGSSRLHRALSPCSVSDSTHRRTAKASSGGSGGCWCK